MVQNISESRRAPAHAKPRGRPKAYDRETALESMRNLFWQQGYAATSLDELSSATQMNRPSLYNAFGDKSAAFKEVLDDYIDYVRQRYTPAFLAQATLREGLTRIYETALDIYQSDPKSPGRGCFMVGAALTDSLRDSEVAAKILAGFHEMDRAFRRRMRIAQAAGELSANADIDALAAIASATHSALSVRMRSGEPVEALRRFYTHAVNMICL